MKTLTTIGTALLFAGFLCAQSNQSTHTETTTTTTTTTYNGTLLDAGCYTTHTKNTETKTDDNTTTKTETHHEFTECPVTTTTTSFGLLTPAGKFVRFDDPGNTRVVEMVKHNKSWTTYMEEKKPIKVRVVGAPNGDVVVIRTIQ